MHLPLIQSQVAGGQETPDLPLPGHLLQLIWEDAEVFPGHNPSSVLWEASS